MRPRKCHQRLWRVLVIAAVAVGLVACPSTRRRRRAPVPAQQGPEPTTFSPPTVCANCHVGISVQYYRSMHSQSLSNPVFRAHYYREYMPVFHEEPKEYKDEPVCLRCHGPVAYMEFFEEAKARIETAGTEDCKGCHNETKIEKTLAAPGVICDVCHRIEGYEGDTPGGGNYIAKPGRLKFGPFDYEQDFHRQYNELQTRSEICGICHNSFNRYGLEVRSTYSEWKNGPYYDKGIQCQDCHMNAQGFLSAGKAVYESGKAAFMTVGEAPKRDKLYTHRFFGAHSESQIDGALSLEIVAPEKMSTGDDVPVKVRVHNEKTGHKMPTGSVELRAVWLEVTAFRQSDYEEEVDFEFRLQNDRTGYAIAGYDDRDQWILGDSVPKGRRIYRAVFADEQGSQTFLSYDAKTRLFDNRLEAGEVREESFLLSVPSEVRGWVTIEAKLHYLRFPPAFAERIRIRPVDSIPFAVGSLEVLIRD